MKTVRAIQNENFGEVSMGQLAPYMSSKYRPGADDGRESGVLDRTSNHDEVPNPDGIYSSKFVMSFVKGLDKMVREEVKSTTAARSKNLGEKYGNLDAN
jgi:hypothetical protein